MITQYVIISPLDKWYVAAGRGVRFTYNLNAAKHFNSQWAAEQFLAKNLDPSGYIIRRIEHQ